MAKWIGPAGLPLLPIPPQVPAFPPDSSWPSRCGALTGCQCARCASQLGPSTGSCRVDPASLSRQNVRVGLSLFASHWPSRRRYRPGRALRVWAAARPGANDADSQYYTGWAGAAGAPSRWRRGSSAPVARRPGGADRSRSCSSPSLAALQCFGTATARANAASASDPISSLSAYAFISFRVFVPLTRLPLICMSVLLPDSLSLSPPSVPVSLRLAPSLPPSLPRPGAPWSTARTRPPAWRGRGRAPTPRCRPEIAAGAPTTPGSCTAAAPPPPARPPPAPPRGRRAGGPGAAGGGAHPGSCRRCWRGIRCRPGRRRPRRPWAVMAATACELEGRSLAGQWE